MRSSADVGAAMLKASLGQGQCSTYAGIVSGFDFSSVNSILVAVVTVELLDRSRQE
jgi:hypothetical protein